VAKYVVKVSKGKIFRRLHVLIFPTMMRQLKALVSSLTLTICSYNVTVSHGYMLWLFSWIMDFISCLTTMAHVTWVQVHSLRHRWMQFFHLGED
jgi:hypothetical protein